jgi:DNA-directed RNA polymerase subunit K/omega
MTLANEDQEPQVQAPAPLPPPVQVTYNRFLFVDVAAQRAKQLRRGALPRLPVPEPPEGALRPDHPHKLERVAMEEVRRGIIPYELPAMKIGLRQDGQ